MTNRGFTKNIWLIDYQHIGAIDPDKGCRTVTVGRNDLRMM